MIISKKKQSSKADTKSLLTGSLIIAFMLFIPYAFYIYKYIPDVETYEIGNYTYISTYYKSVRYFTHALFSKFIPLILLLIWFTTCKHWWYYSIAIPIAVYTFQLIGVVNGDANLYDEYEFVYSLPFTMVLLAILYYIRTRISTYLKAVDLKKRVDQKIEEGIEKRKEILKEKGF